MSRTSPVQLVRKCIASPKWQADTEYEPHNHIYGLRGILAISGMLWIFFQTFVPAIVSNPGYNTPGQPYEKIVRIVFSPILWDASLIQSFFFALSARSICVRFLSDPKPSTWAGSVIRRIIRMVVGVGLASLIASGIFMAIGSKDIANFKYITGNRSIESITVPHSALQVFNSIFDLFWVVRSYYWQAANNFWPSNTLWNVSLIYQQSWTIYFLMIILPYTRADWHAEGLAVFAAGSFWMCTWGYYDAAAILLTDMIANPKLRNNFMEGWHFTQSVTIPWLVPGSIMTVAGLAMRYCWAVFPQFYNSELVLHPYLDLSENTSRAEFAAADPYPRVDNFLIIYGLLLLIETTQMLRNVLSAKWLVALGKRSLSIFVAQSIIFWTAGISLFLRLHVKGKTSTGIANLAVFFVGSLATLVFAEIYWRVIDLPSQRLAKAAYLWLLE